MITYLKDVGAEVSYSRIRTTFFYRQKFDLEVQITVKALNNEEVCKIMGGCVFSFPSDDAGRRVTIFEM